MKKNTFKKLGIVAGTGCLGLIMGSAQAAGLNSFTNGSVANATDVNNNFTYLDDRITNISLTPGETGPTGPTGPQGPIGLTGSQGTPGVNGQNGLNGLDGATGPAGATGPQGPAGTDGVNGTDGTNGTNGVGIVIQSATGFHPDAYTEKVFSVTGTQAGWDKEVRSFNRTINADSTITTLRTRQRTSAGVIVRHDVQKFITDLNGDVGYAEKKNYDAADITALVNTANISPPLVELKNNMGIGLRWGSASQVTYVYEDVNIPTDISFAVDSRSLLGIEDVTLSNGDAYSGCLKIETIRSAESLGRNQQKISWHCPNGVGLVKYIMLMDTETRQNSRAMELDTSASTPTGVF